MEKRSGYVDVDGIKKDFKEKLGSEPRKQDSNQIGRGYFRQSQKIVCISPGEAGEWNEGWVLGRTGE